MDTAADNLEAAIAYAAWAHARQVDKCGVPYVLHPLRVMLAVSPRTRRVAVLHDVIEDTGQTMADVRANVYLTPGEVAALRLVTRPPKDTPNRPTYREFITAIADTSGEAGAIAREVKVADIADNLRRLTPELEGMRERYGWALKRLLGVEDPEMAGRIVVEGTPEQLAEHASRNVRSRAEAAASRIRGGR